MPADELLTDPDLLDMLGVTAEQVASLPPHVRVFIVELLAAE
jgi:hypothetical protein